MKIVKKKISELKPAEYNPRRMTQKQKQDIKNSLTEFGMVDPIIINTFEGRENVIVGGHQRVKVWQEMGNKEVDCVEVCLDLEREKELNVRLNANTGEWDVDSLKEWFGNELLKDWGLSIKYNNDEDGYTTKIISPIYEPKGECPNIYELVDTERYEEIKSKIEKAKIDSKIKDFLLNAATRFIRINFAKTAEFYSHLTDKKTKELFEDLALVIIDYDKAIENGFVRVWQSINKLAEADE